jgi:GntR family transcriptional regulator/MocR family aminotransferase
MRSLYAERQAVLVDAAAQDLKDLLEVSPADAGMHLVGRLAPGVNDQVASARAIEHGVYAPQLSSYYIGEPGISGLLLGYTGVSEPEIREGVRRLVAALKSL